MIEIESTSRAAAEVAKAGGKIADFGGKSIDAGVEIGRYLSGSSIKTIPRAVISLLGGDWIIHKQVENIIKIQAKIHQIAADHNLRLDPETLPWRIKMEAVRGMADEDDKFLQEKWAEILVGAMRDDNKRLEIDRIVIDVFKRLNPLSARLLVFVGDEKSGGNRLRRRKLVAAFSEQEDIRVKHAAMVMDHLTQLRCVQHLPASKNDHSTSISTLGKELILRLQGY